MFDYNFEYKVDVNQYMSEEAKFKELNKKYH